MATNPIERSGTAYQQASVFKASSDVVTVVTPVCTSSDIDLLGKTYKSLILQSIAQWKWLITLPEEISTANANEFEQLLADDCRVVVQVLDSATCSIGALTELAIAQIETDSTMLLLPGDVLEVTALEKLLWCLKTRTQYRFVTPLQALPDCPAIPPYEELFAYEEKKVSDYAAYLDDINTISGTLIDTGTLRSTHTLSQVTTEEQLYYHFLKFCLQSGFGGTFVFEYLFYPDSSREISPRLISHNDFHNAYSFQFVASTRELLSLDLNSATNPAPFPFVSRAKTRPRLLMFVCPLETGGSTKFNLDLIRELSKLNWDITVVVPINGKQRWMPMFLEETPDIFVLRKFIDHHDFYHFCLYMLASRTPDVVLITHDRFAYDILPCLRANDDRPLYIDYIHVDREYFGEGGFAAISAHQHWMLDFSIVSSEQLKSYMGNLGASLEKIQVAYTNINSELICPDAQVRNDVRETLDIKDDLPVMLFAARLEEQKQPDVLIASVNELIKRGRNFVCLIAGDGAFEELLNNFIASNNLQFQIRMLGNVSNAEVSRLMKASDIFFLPSKWEGISLAIYEAMACGLAIVAADVGGQKELVTPDCGFLVSPTDKSADANTYANLLDTLLLDPDRRKQMQKNSRARVSNYFRLDQMGKRMSELFELARSYKKPFKLNSALPKRLVEDYISQIIATERLGYLGYIAQFQAKKIGVPYKNDLDRIAELNDKVLPNIQKQIDEGKNIQSVLREQINKLETEKRQSENLLDNRLLELRHAIITKPSTADGL